MFPKKFCRSFSGSIGWQGHYYVVAVWSLYSGYTLLDRVRSLVIWEELKVHIERSQLRWFGHLIRMPPGAAYWTRP